MFMLIVVTLILITRSLDCDQFYTNECPNDWFKYKNSKCVAVIRELTLDYTQAVSQCQELNASLVTISSEEENLFLTSLFHGLDVKVKGLYIGLKRKVQNDSYLNEFEWTDGSDLVYENWAQDEPSPWFEPCVEMYSVDINAGKWNDLSCSGLRYAICQRWINQSIGDQFRMKFELCEHLDYIRYRNNCYKIYDFQWALDWNAADRKCKADHQNGSLVYIQDSYEYSFLRYWTKLELKTFEFWIGLIAMNNSQSIQYQWVNDYPVYFTAWEPTQPRVRPESSVQCIVQDRDTGLWRIDVYCADRRAFVCKISDHIMSGDQTYVNATCPTFANTSSHHKSDQWINLHKNLKHCHWFSDINAMTWVDASKHCHKRNGSLVSIHSRHESEVLKPFVQKSGRPLWIGLYQSPGGFFRWEDGSDLDYQNWFPGEPTDEKQELCVEMRAQDMTWNDIHCSLRELQFICETNKIIPLSRVIENKALIGNKTEVKDVVPVSTKDNGNRVRAKGWVIGLIWCLLVVILIAIFVLLVYYFCWESVSDFFNVSFSNISLLSTRRAHNQSSNVRDSQRSSVQVFDVNVY